LRSDNLERQVYLFVTRVSSRDRDFKRKAGMVRKLWAGLDRVFRTGPGAREHSQCVEAAQRGHTIVLGWSSQTATIVSELLTSSGHPRPAVFVMADRNERVMDASIRQRVSGDTGAALLCVSGHPTESDDIDRLGPQHASSILVLPGEEADADAEVLQTILAVANSALRHHTTYHVVAVLQDPNHAAVAQATASGLDIEVVTVDDLIGRVMAQCCLEPKLLPVFEELLTYAGNEIYISPESRLAGSTFGDALYCYETSSPLGLRLANGDVRVCPALYTAISEGDQIIAVSADDNTINVRLTEDATIDEHDLETRRVPAPAPCRILIVGYNRRAWQLIKQLDRLVANGSELKLVVEASVDLNIIRYLERSVTNLQVVVEHRRTSDPHVLDGLLAEHYDHVVVLLRTDVYGAEDAVARTVAIMRHMRDAAWRSNRPFSLMGEISDVEHDGLPVSIPESDGLLKIDRMVSLLVSQVSDSRERSQVFEQLFDASGPRFCFRPATAYVKSNRAVSFYTVVEAARRRGEVAVGYWTSSNRSARADGRAVLNPLKTQPITFTDQDAILVLARQG
jgi:hypothetical protein